MSRSLVVVLALLILSLLSWAFSGRLIFLRLSYLWGLLIVGSWFWARSTLKGIQFRRDSTIDRAQVGQVFSEQFEVKNTGRIPILWLEVKDESELPGFGGSRVLTLISGNKIRTFFSRQRLLQRGVFSLGPTTLIAGDGFGLFRVRRVVSADGTLLVYPSLYPVQEFPNPVGLLPGGEALHRVTMQVTSNASGVREYTPGDSWNRIHWLSTARRSRLMVKEFELDPRAEVWIFLDGERDSQAALPFTWQTMTTVSLQEFFSQVDTPPLTEEYLVTIAASLSRYYIEQGRSVGMVENGEWVKVLAPDRGFRQFSKILQSLALFQAESDVPFIGVISSHARYISRGSTIILITPSVDEEITGCVDQIYRLGLSPIVILVDADSFGGLPGSYELEQSIQQLLIPVKILKKGEDIGMFLSSFS